MNVEKGKRYRHVARGTVYTVVGFAEIQSAGWATEGSELVIYRSDDGKLWARERSEFADGRFEPAEPIPPPWKTAYFTGVRPGDRAGHYCFTPDFRSQFSMNGKRSPWASPTGIYPLSDNGVTGPIMWPESHDKHGRLASDGRGRGEDNQPEGRARVTQKDGWTLLFLWDRSADQRGGCCAGFAFDALLDPEAALDAVRATWPTVIARIEKHLGRSVVLDGGTGRVPA